MALGVRSEVECHMHGASTQKLLLRRFCKPLDMVLLRQMAREHPVMITVEENGIGGFGSHGLRSATLHSRLSNP